ncbi:glycosyltransferase family 4 protein [Kineococcus sp. NUM-3379]
MVRGLVEELARQRPDWDVEVAPAFAGAGFLEGFDGVSDVIAAWRLGRRAAAARADVLLVHCPECVWGLRLLAPRRLGRTVVVWHGAGAKPYLALRPEGNLAARALAWFRTTEERRALALEHHVVVHATVERDLAAEYGNTRPVTVIENATDLRSVAQADPGGTDRPFTAAWVGQAGRRKGLDVALEALAQAQRVRPELRLLVAGVPAGPALPGVTWLGVVPPDQVAGIYRSADLLLFPTRYESYGLVVVEAMAAGLPVIVSDEVPAGIVGDGRNGRIIAGHEAGEYAAALLEYASDPELVRRTSAANRLEARRFSLEAATARYVELIEQLAGEVTRERARRS